jgi:hypothetical protein
MNLSGKELKTATRLLFLIGIILPGAWPAFADEIRLDLVGFWHHREPFVMRNGSADGGAMAVSDPLTGVSLNIQSVASAQADIDDFDFADYGEDAKGQETITWGMELTVVGNPGASAEVFGEWNLWMAYYVRCWPVLGDWPLPSGTTATMETGATILVQRTVCIGHFCFEVEMPFDEATAYVGDGVLWWGVDGGGMEDSGDFSLGTYDVGEHSYVKGMFSSLAWANEAPFGRQPAGAITTCDCMWRDHRRHPMQSLNLHPSFSLAARSPSPPWRRVVVPGIAVAPLKEDVVLVIDHSIRQCRRTQDETVLSECLDLQASAVGQDGNATILVRATQQHPSLGQSAEHILMGEAIDVLVAI